MYDAGLVVARLHLTVHDSRIALMSALKIELAHLANFQPTAFSAALKVSVDFMTHQLP